MRFALMIEPQQGLTYGQHVAIAKRAEANGFETLFRSDHYASFPGRPGQHTTDAWTVIGGLARDTDRIGLGVLVSPVTFRPPGTFAKIVTTADEMSGGRIEVGVGAGWNELEHRQQGIRFPPLAERMDAVEDQFAVLHGLWHQPDGWSYTGRTVTIEDACFHPRPVAVPGRPTGPDGAPRPNLIFGGSGAPRGLRATVAYADEFNTLSAGPEVVSDTYAKLDAACAAAGRDPRTIVRSVMAGVLVGRTDAEVQARSQALIEAFGDDADDDLLEERRDRWVFGTGEPARAMIERFAAVGVERIMLQDFIPWDLDHIDAMGELLVGKI